MAAGVIVYIFDRIWLEFSPIVSVTIAVVPKTMTALISLVTPEVADGQPLCTLAQTFFGTWRLTLGVSRSQEAAYSRRNTSSNCVAAARALASPRMAAGWPAPMQA